VEQLVDAIESIHAECEGQIRSFELISFLMGRIVAGCNLFSPLRAVRGESAVAPRFDEFSEDRGTHQGL
jgi:hypothetical protein